MISDVVWAAIEHAAKQSSSYFESRGTQYQLVMPDPGGEQVCDICKESGVDGVLGIKISENLAVIVMVCSECKHDHNKLFDFAFSVIPQECEVVQ